MLLNVAIDLHNHSTRALSFNKEKRWLQAIRHGFANPAEAQLGGEAYLRYATRMPSPFFLNDNTCLRGPWFDSLDWLAAVWVPQASRLGLCYVAHVLPANLTTASIPAHLSRMLPFELQIFWASPMPSSGCGTAAMPPCSPAG